MTENLERLDIEPLKKLYDLVEEIKSDEIVAANKGHKTAYTRMRTKLSEVSKLCKDARKEILEARDGKAGR